MLQKSIIFLLIQRANLLGVCLRQRPSEHREVLGEDDNSTSVDAALACGDAVAQILAITEAEFRRAVCDEAVELEEGSFIKKQIKPLPRRKLAFGVLCLDPLYAATQLGLRLELLKPLKLILHGCH